MKHSNADTITAIVTPQGIGGVGVVRISGGQSLKISEDIVENFPQDILPAKVYRRWVRNEGGRVDDALLYFLKAPNSFTGEDTVEVNCHGGQKATQLVLRAAIKSGARLARRGEFTLRAFLNGKLGLIQAEAILDLIEAKSDEAAAEAIKEMEGRLSSTISRVREQILAELSEIEAGIDFPDDVEAGSAERLTEKLTAISGTLRQLIKSANKGKQLRYGARVAIVGKPNVGKSSLMNALLGADRVLVTEMPGTTRDTIEETIIINGIPITFIDTAGWREPIDIAESAGIEKGKLAGKAADLIIGVLDNSRPIETDDGALLAALNKEGSLIVINKADLKQALSLNGQAIGWDKYVLSAKTGEGLEELKAGIAEKLSGGGRENQYEYYVNERQAECLVKAGVALERAIRAIGVGVEKEAIAVDLKASIGALGELSGEQVSEEVLGRIFEKFCVGK